MKRRAWLFYLMVMVPITFVYLLGPSVVSTGPIFNLVSASSVIAILAGARLHGPRAILTWHLFALGLALFLAGDVIAYNYERLFNSPLPSPSIANALYLAVYPSLIAGLLILSHIRKPGRDWASLIDSLIIAVAAGVVLWVVLMAPYSDDSSISLLVRLTSIAYPLLDILLLTVMIRIFVAAGKRGPSFYFLTVSVFALLVTNSIYGWMLLHGGYDSGGLLDGGWAAFYLLWGAAALHPSMRWLSEPVPAHEGKLTRGRLALLAGASLIAPGAQAIQFALSGSGDVLVLAGSAVALFLLVIARMAGLIHKEEQSATREKALREAGAALVTATNRQSLYRATLEAARTLVGEDHGVWLSLVSDTEGQLEVVATSRSSFEDGQGMSMQFGELPDVVQTELLNQRSAEIKSKAFLRKSSRADDGDVSVFVFPLFIRGELRGVLSIAGEVTLPEVIRDGLEALAFEVALALESAALTEDLLRRQSEARFSSLVQNSSDMVTVISPDTKIHYLSPAVERVLGYRPDELEGKMFADLIHPGDTTRVLTFFSTGAHEARTHPGLIEFRMRHSDGEWLSVETLRTNLMDDPNVEGIVLNTRDISERKAFEEQLSHQAFHDAVTGLANRALFKDRVEHALERERRKDGQVAVLFMDLDDFKTVNDSLGHAAGDLLLCDVARRLRECLRSVDTAARLGGDEFAILLEDVGESGVEAADVAERLMRALEPPCHLDGKDVVVRASLGIAMADLDGRGAQAAEELLRNADVAMYTAKEQGKSRYQVFKPEMHATVLERLELKADLQRALDNGEFMLQYQPIMVLKTGEVSGVEALVRWQHPERGMVPPADFIPLAEDTGLIVPIGRWVLETACTEARRLQEQSSRTPPLTMSVNLSARQLQRPELVTEVKDALEKTGLAPETLVLEITESVMMQNMDLSILRLHELKNVGVRIAVDDFGTGYSSLNYIRRFPLDVLKLDKSFIDVVNQGGEDSALTAAIIELAEILSLSAVAEGIEGPEQFERLIDLGCELGQGYYFARPLHTEVIQKFVSEGAPDKVEADPLTS